MEALRWRPFMDALLAVVPELRTMLLEYFAPGDPSPFTPQAASVELEMELLDEDDFPTGLDSDLWSRILAFLEVVEEIMDHLESWGDEENEDLTTLDAFGPAGILCTVTKNPEGLQALLPWMGPKTVIAAQRELEVHDRRNTAWNGEHIDWTVWSARFAPLRIDTERLLPLE